VVFWHEVVTEMNASYSVRFLACRRRNVAEYTRVEKAVAIAYSPRRFKATPRNKSDEEIRFIVEHGGFVGVTMFRLLANGNNATVDGLRPPAIDSVIRIAARTHRDRQQTSPRTRTTAFSEHLGTTKGFRMAG